MEADVLTPQAQPAPFTREVVQQALEALLDGVSVTHFSPTLPGLAVGEYSYLDNPVRVFFLDAAQLSVKDLPLAVLAPIVAGDMRGLLVLSEGECTRAVSADELLRAFRGLYGDTAIVETLEEYLTFRENALTLMRQ